MPDPKTILDAAAAFADEYEFRDDRFRSEATYSAASGANKFTVRIVPEPPGFLVDASEGKVLEAVKKYICDQIGEKPIPKEKAPAVLQKAPPSKGLAGLTAQDIINYINPKATEQEAWLFAEFCRRKGADPMTKQVYLAIFEGEGGRQVSFIAGKEYFTEKAETHPQFDGMKAGIIVRPKEGSELIHREGTFYLSSEETLLGGWAEVHRKDRKIPTKVNVVLGEYNTGKRNWAKMPATMIRKVAVVQALREAFPQNLGGMYDRAEMEQALVPAEEA